MIQFSHNYAEVNFKLFQTINDKSQVLYSNVNKCQVQICLETTDCTKVKPTYVNICLEKTDCTKVKHTYVNECKMAGLLQLHDDLKLTTAIFRV